MEVKKCTKKINQVFAEVWDGSPHPAIKKQGDKYLVGAWNLEIKIGDYLVSDLDKKDFWVVNPEVFEATYRKVAGEDKRWESIPLEYSYRVSEGEILKTLEGEYSVPKGHYILKGIKGEEWAMSPEKFFSKYEIKED